MNVPRFEGGEQDARSQTAQQLSEGQHPIGVEKVAGTGDNVEETVEHAHGAVPP